MPTSTPSNALMVSQQLRKMLEEVHSLIESGLNGEPQSPHNNALAIVTMDSLVYSKLIKPLQEIAASNLKQIPAGTHWQASDGTVFQITTRDGRFVSFDHEVLSHTRRGYLDETKGSMSLTAARGLGYVVEGK